MTKQTINPDSFSQSVEAERAVSAVRLLFYASGEHGQVTSSATS